jgi:hypothetical protein
MSITDCYTYTVTGQRQVWSNNKSSLVATEGFAAHVQQAQPEFAEQLGQHWGQVFKVWCGLDIDVMSGDTLTISGGAHAGTYSVKNVQKFAMGDVDDHLELICIKDVS